jgi:DNA-directed RNA polymerase specialized sigma subunit
MERTEAELISAVPNGNVASFEPLVQRYSPRVFATARRYARRESEVEDIDFILPRAERGFFFATPW